MFEGLRKEKRRKEMMRRRRKRKERREEEKDEKRDKKSCLAWSLENSQIWYCNRKAKWRVWV